MSFFDNLIGLWANGETADTTQATSDRLDAERQRMNQDDRQTYGEDWYQQTVKNDQASRQDVAGDINAGWDEGYAEGEQNLTNAVAAPFKLVGDASGSILKGVWKGVPLWVWIGLAVGAFFYFGGGALIRKMIAKKVG